METVALNSLEKAMHYMDINKSRSFVHMLVALNLRPEWKLEMSSVFLSLANSLSEELLAARRVKDFFEYFEQALGLYPESPELKQCFSKHLENLGYTFRAFSFLNCAVRLKPEEPLWTKQLDNIKNVLVERWHFRMLNDSVRNNAYRRALSYCVNKESSVLDIGCGTGLLTLYAAENNPARLVAVECSETLYNVCMTVFGDNGLNNVIVKNHKSTALQPSDILGKVSIVVTEIFDGGFFGEGILQTMIHARKYLMQNVDTDIIIPKSGSLYICGLQSRILSPKFCVSVTNSNSREEMKLNNLVICNNLTEPYDTEDLTKIQDLKYVTDVHNFLNVNFTDLECMERLYSGKEKLDVELKMNTSANIDALGVWFDLHLCNDVNLTTDPRDENRANAWEQAVIYLANSPVGQEKSTIKVSLSCRGGKLSALTKPEIYSENYYSVPPYVVRILNDEKYFDTCNMAAGAICVHLSQIVPLKDMHALDLSPFPLIGLLLLNRGIQTLTCSVDSSIIQSLIINITKSNGVHPSKVHFLCKDTDVNYQDYNVIVNNYFVANTHGELNSDRIKQAINFIQRNTMNTVIVPYKIRMMGRLIYSEEVERINRVNNIHVSHFKIAESINIFQVGQNYISDISLFPYATMSKDVVIFEQCIEQCNNTIIDVEIIQDGLINAVLCWYEIQLLEKWEFYSSFGPDSFLDTTLHVLELNLSGRSNQIGSLLVCVENYYIKLAVDLDVPV